MIGDWTPAVVACLLAAVDHCLLLENSLELKTNVPKIMKARGFPRNWRSINAKLASLKKNGTGDIRTGGSRVADISDEIRELIRSEVEQIAAGHGDKEVAGAKKKGKPAAASASASRKRSREDDDERIEAGPSSNKRAKMAASPQEEITTPPPTAAGSFRLLQQRITELEEENRQLKENVHELQSEQQRQQQNQNLLQTTIENLTRRMDKAEAALKAPARGSSPGSSSPPKSPPSVYQEGSRFGWQEGLTEVLHDAPEPSASQENLVSSPVPLEATTAEVQEDGPPGERRCSRKVVLDEDYTDEFDRSSTSSRNERDEAMDRTTGGPSTPGPSRSGGTFPAPPSSTWSSVQRDGNLSTSTPLIPSIQVTRPSTERDDEASEQNTAGVDNVANAAQNSPSPGFSQPGGYRGDETYSSDSSATYEDRDGSSDSSDEDREDEDVDMLVDELDEL